jgi:DNA-binding XRE family transcriptional regulator
MTNEREKNAAWLADRLRADLPASKVTVHKPSPKSRGTGWVIDADYRDHSVVVMWTKADGFGLATPKDDEPYGASPSEIHGDGDEALARVLHLLKTGEQARSHREMRLQALRTHRSFSQEVLAKAMQVSQASVSQTERRDDVMISTLQNYIEGLGGKLRVVAEFPGEKIELELGTLSNVTK